MSVPPGRRNGRRIIVTDDNPTRLYALSQTLRDAGHCAFAAYDGESALELVVLLPDVDLLITNTRLGLVDGAELMRRTRIPARPADPPRVAQRYRCRHPGWGADHERAVQPERAPSRCPPSLGLKPRVR